MATDTSSSNLSSIGENGLFSKRERTAAAVTTTKTHGAVYGDGIYVGNNPHTFARYGDTCVVCIVIRGHEVRRIAATEWICCSQRHTQNKLSASITIQCTHACLPTVLVPLNSVRTIAFLGGGRIIIIPRSCQHCRIQIWNQIRKTLNTVAAPSPCWWGSQLDCAQSSAACRQSNAN